jgi:hypothetical protein
LQPLTPDRRRHAHRGRATLGATGFIVLADYAELLRADGGHVFLSGVGPDLREQLRHTRRVDQRDAVTVVPASDTILNSRTTTRRSGSPGTLLALIRRSLDDG